MGQLVYTRSLFVSVDWSSRSDASAHDQPSDKLETDDDNCRKDHVEPITGEDCRAPGAKHEAEKLSRMMMASFGRYSCLISRDFASVNISRKFFSETFTENFMASP